MTKEIDITYQVTKNNYKEKFETLKEMIVWLAVNVGEYKSYETDTKASPFLYAYGDEWQIKIYTDEFIEKHEWKVWINDEALATIFMLKFL